MKKFLPIPVITIALLLVSFSYPPDSWIQYRSDEGHFSVSFPDSTEESSLSVTSEAGLPRQMHFVKYEADDFHQYTLSWVDIRNSYPENKSLKELLEDCRDAAAKNIKATDVKTITTNLTGDPYIEFTMSTDDYMTKGRFYIINKIQYSLVTVYSTIIYAKAKGIPDDADKFLTSFRHLP